jgi:hypothetical protein
MITILTNPGTRETQLSAKERFINTANAFLRHNGVSTETGMFLGRDLYFQADCSNQAYTRAFALLLLISTFSASGFYVGIRLKDKTPGIYVESSDWEKAEAWVFDNMNCTVQSQDRGKVAGEKFGF